MRQTDDNCRILVVGACIVVLAVIVSDLSFGLAQFLSGFTQLSPEVLFRTMVTFLVIAIAAPVVIKMATPLIMAVIIISMIMPIIFNPTPMMILSSIMMSSIG